MLSRYVPITTIHTFFNEAAELWQESDGGLPHELLKLAGFEFQDGGIAKPLEM